VRPIPVTSPPIIDSRAAAPEPSPFIQGTLAISFAENDDDSDRADQDPDDSEFFGPQPTFSSDPAPQLIRWTTPEVYSVVARRHAASRRRAMVASRATVRRVRICEPADGVVEACAVVVDNGRVRALAMRLTGLDRRWVVSVLQVG